MAVEEDMKKWEQETPIGGVAEVGLMNYSLPAVASQLPCNEGIQLRTKIEIRRLRCDELATMSY